jgi:endoglucanase Acf2
MKRRESQEIKFLKDDDSSSSIPRQQSFFQDERSTRDVESPSTEDGTLNLEAIEIVNESQGQLGCLGPGTRRRRVYLAVFTAVLLLIVLSLSIALGVHDRKEKSSVASVANSDSESDSSSSKGSKVYANDSGVYPPTPPEGTQFYAAPFSPLSTLDPVEDLGLYSYDRPAESSPSTRLDQLNRRAIPTNSWYQNILRLNAGEEPTNANKAFLVPYVVDMAGDIPGVRIHVTRVLAEASQVTLTIDEPYALTLGAMTKGATNGESGLGKGYTVSTATELGITLDWDSYGMRSSLVRGSPFITMVYDSVVKKSSLEATTKQTITTNTVVPTIYLEIGVSDIAADGSTIDVNQYCGPEDASTTISVQSEFDMSFYTGQRWLVYFSRPVALQCRSSQGSNTIVQVVSDGNVDQQQLIVRVAQVFTSARPVEDSTSFETTYINQLRASRDFFPGEMTSVLHSFDVESGPAAYTKITFNWDTQSMSGVGTGSSDMVMYAMPHHQDLLDADVKSDLCVSSLLGPVCIVQGTSWEMIEPLPVADFRAPRHPSPDYVEVLAEALMDDIKYQVPVNFQIGAGDTYFSGKTVAKLARILLITEELKGICDATGLDAEYVQACEGLTLPSDEDVNAALDQLRRVVTVWIKENDQAPSVYDSAWGGVVSCGCIYQDGQCTNQFPSCPAFTDQGLNFGAGFYNDHHFHYG